MSKKKPSGPTIKHIESMCTDQSFVKGDEYYKLGNVEEATVNGCNGSIHAQVAGTYRYDVIITKWQQKPNMADCYCTCPYNYEGVCKHIVAVFLHIRANFADLVAKHGSNTNAIRQAFSTASTEDLKSFLEDTMKYDIGLQKQFMLRFDDSVDSKERIEENLYYEIREVYRKAGGTYEMLAYGHEIDFTEFFLAADERRKKGSHDEAILMYRAISRAIADHMDWVDDSDAYYAERFEDALSGMESCIKSSRLTHQQKRPHILYMFEKYLENEPDYFAEMYVPLLENVCTDRDDHEYLRSMLEPRLPTQIPDLESSKHYDAIEKIMMYIHILEKLKDKSLDDVLAKHHLGYYQICMLYIKRLKKTNPDEATKVLKKGLTLFKNYSEFTRFARKMSARK